MERAPPFPTTKRSLYVLHMLRIVAAHSSYVIGLRQLHLSKSIAPGMEVYASSTESATPAKTTILARISQLDEMQADVLALTPITIPPLTDANLPA